MKSHITKTLLEFLPSFCWQNARQVTSMLKVLDKGANELSVSVILTRLAGQGRLERRYVTFRSGSNGPTLRAQYKRQERPSDARADTGVGSTQPVPAVSATGCAQA